MGSSQSIAELAYELWIGRGRPHGSAEADWLEAERRLAAGGTAATRDAGVDGSLKETFPASDPVASRIPDLPPSNADDKWSAAGKPRRTKAKAASAGAKATGSRKGRKGSADDSDADRASPEA
jgi:hypothetical protein